MKAFFTINYVKYYQLYHLGIICTTVILVNLSTGVGVTECEGIPALQHALYPNDFEDVDKSLQKESIKNYEAYIANKVRNDNKVAMKEVFHTPSVNNSNPTIEPITSNVSPNNNLSLLTTQRLENINNIIELPDSTHLSNKDHQLINPSKETQIMSQECIEAHIQSSGEPLPLTLVPISQHDDLTRIHPTSLPHKNITPITCDIPLELNLPITCTINKPDIHIIPHNVPIAIKDLYLYKKQSYLRYMPDTGHFIDIDYKTEAQIIDELEMSYSIKKIQLIDPINSKLTTLPTGQLPIAKEALKDIPSVLKQQNIVGRHQAYHPIVLAFFDYVNSDNYDPLTPANFVFNHAELLFTESSDYLIEHFDLIWSTADKSNQEYVLYHKNFMVHALYMIKLKEIASNFNESINLFDTSSIFNDIKTFINFRYPEYPL